VLTDTWHTLKVSVDRLVLQNHSVRGGISERPYDWMTISQGDSRWPGGYFSNLASARTPRLAVVQRSNGETDVLAVATNGALYYYSALGIPNWNQLTVAASGVK
jgi:hypothetical protein